LRGFFSAHRRTSIADIDSFVTVALFSLVGLLLSLVVLILDQNIAGEWF